MKKNNLFKSLLSLVIVSSIFSVSFATTTQKGRDIVDQLRDDDWTDNEIRRAMNDLGYDANEYLGKSNNTTGKTTAQGRKILEQYKKDGWTDDEIKQAFEDLGLDTSGYFPEGTTALYSNNNSPTYISRSCKPYIIEYVSSLNAYTSPDLLRKEYFVSIDYLKRYIDSRNAQSAECYINGGRISSSYIDTYNGTDRYTAPNGKIYFIKGGNGSYTSSELATYKTFSTIDELKNYIKERNPLISMGTISSKNNDPIKDLWNEILN